MEIFGVLFIINLEYKFVSVFIGDIVIFVFVECDGKDCDFNVIGVNEFEVYILGKSKEFSLI